MQYDRIQLQYCAHKISRNFNVLLHDSFDLEFPSQSTSSIYCVVHTTRAFIKTASKNPDQVQCIEYIYIRSDKLVQDS